MGTVNIFSQSAMYKTNDSPNEILKRIGQKRELIYVEKVLVHLKNVIKIILIVYHDLNNVPGLTF